MSIWLEVSTEESTIAQHRNSHGRQPLICTDPVSWSLIRRLFWWVRSSAGCSSRSVSVPVTSKMSRLFSAALGWVRSAFGDICRSGSSRRSCWTTNRLQQKCHEIKKTRRLCPTAQSTAQVCKWEEPYLKAAPRSWRPRTGRCLCPPWKREFRSCPLTSEWTRSPPPGGERTSAPLRPVGTDIGPLGAAVLLRHRAPPAARRDLAWRLNGSSPGPTRTRLENENPQP